MPVETLRVDRPPVEELASRIQETHRYPDPYYFLIDQDGDLFSPSHNLKVIDIINTDYEVGQLEREAFVAISSWSRRETKGAVAWISPPNPYPVSKVIVSEIEFVNGIKRLFNRALVLDIDGRECLELGRNLARFSLNQPFLTSSEDLRATPIILDTTRDWINILAEFITDTSQIEAIRTGRDIITKKAALAQAGVYYSADLGSRPMMMREMLGDRAESCPPQTAFQVFSGNALSIGTGSLLMKDKDYCIRCGACGQEIRCVVRRGQKCPKCPAVRKC